MYENEKNAFYDTYLCVYTLPGVCVSLCEVPIYEHVRVCVGPYTYDYMCGCVTI